MTDDTLMKAAIKGSVAVSTALLLQACVPTPGADDKQAAKEEYLQGELEKQAGDAMPAGAIQIGDDLYMAPVAIDAEGCEQFRQWSGLGVMQLAIHFRDGEGGFSPIKSAENSCNATMVETGPDQDGCQTFRAEQPDGSATDVTYYDYQGGGYTVRKDRSVCAS